MRTHLLKTQSAHAVVRPSRHAAASTTASGGWISELTYSEDQPGMTQMLLLPLLQQLGTQSRWQLWLTPPQKLSRHWLQQSGLPLDKVMQIPQSAEISTVDAMIKALQTGNYSVVLGWLPEEIDRDDRRRLDEAAAMGQALGLIMRPQYRVSASARPESGLKIHSTLYH
ncbi:cell division inhibitor SulA [Erwiniaceae bacterium BAC15a-03b]|uniref:Cell division inhibitor SulA n=1 Tax=Winslowiella arboricola TaxID=2978220 RepID=A0A9J6PXD6_9GAMM|nr:SOS-induced cell division inhibitor SulA [Winslowiella arboricola]MCU5775149.1 cell division inhibitor SulA [Winslowiella arboricola]MCU5780397.1 cell division inhibitor SulA [Winslowiella arboricola]